MLEQREELAQLMDERRKLLTIQDQLQKLHDQLPGVRKGVFLFYGASCMDDYCH